MRPARLGPEASRSKSGCGNVQVADHDNRVIQRWSRWACSTGSWGNCAGELGNQCNFCDHIRVISWVHR